MIGSTFLHTEDPMALGCLAEDLDSVDSFAHVDMDTLITLDLEVVCTPAGVRWAAPQPVIYDEGGGLAVFKIQPEGIAFILGNTHLFSAAQQADLELLRAFVAAKGADHIYELAAF